MAHIEQQEKERTLVTTTDGEILSDTTSSKSKHIITRRITPDKFVQMYIEDLADIYKIKSSTQVNLLLVLCGEARFPEGEELSTFTALKDDKNRWADKLEIKQGKTIDNALSELRKKEIIVQTSRSKYAINPKYFHYGALKNREGLTELIIKYKYQ